MLPTPVAAAVRSACEPHGEWITAQIGLGRNAMAIYQELVDTRGFSVRYNSVKRFCRTLRQREPEQFDRLEFLPGEEAQVDTAKARRRDLPRLVTIASRGCS